MLAVFHVFVQAHRHAIGHALGAVRHGNGVCAHEQRAGSAQVGAGAVIVELHADFHLVDQHAVEHASAALEDFGLFAHGSGQSLLCFKPALSAHVVADVLHHFRQHGQHETVLATLTDGGHLHGLVLATQHLLGLGAQLVDGGEGHLVARNQSGLSLVASGADVQVGRIGGAQGVGVTGIAGVEVADFVTHTTGTGSGGHDDLLVQLFDVLGQLLATLLLQVVAHAGLLDAGTHVHAMAELVDAHRVCGVLQLELLTGELLALGDGSAAQLGHQCGGHFVAVAFFQLRLLDDGRARALFANQTCEILLLSSVVCYCRSPCFPFVRVRGQNCRACHLVFLSKHC